MATRRTEWRQVADLRQAVEQEPKMLRTRVWMGALLLAFVGAILWADAALGRYAFLFLLLVVALAWLACFEMLSLLAPALRPWPWVCYGGVALVLLSTLLPRVTSGAEPSAREPWIWIAWAFTTVVLLILVVAMADFREPGRTMPRIALAVWIVAYLGWLPCYLVELRWLGGSGASEASAPWLGTLCLALGVLVPKSGDIGAYFTGRFLGRHRMAPVLSPKKTWEGAAGGLAAAVGAAIGLDRLGPVLPTVWAEVGFGLTVGGAGMLGDLAESLMKRDCGQKDASNVVPGFGGVLDVVDSIIVAAPVAYCWLNYN